MHKQSRQRHITALITALTALALLLLPPGAARAQSAIRIASLRIRVWPEYDRPEVLVFYSGTLAADSPLPADLAFTLPPGAELNATAYIEAETGDLLTAPNTVEGDTVRMISPNGSFLVEFYDPAIESDGDQRTYSLTWQSEYDVELIAWEIQQPAGTTGLAVTPDDGQVALDEVGLNIYQMTGERVPAGTAATVSASYTRTADGLTVELLEPASTSTTSTSGGQALDSTAIILIAVGAIVLIGGVIGYFVMSGERSARAEPARTRSGGKASGQRFCTQCGKAVQTSDRFCRHCGAKL